MAVSYYWPGSSVRADVAIEKVVPLVILRDAVSVPYQSRLPVVNASMRPTPSTVPQSAVAAGNVSVPEFADVPADAAENVTGTRAYEPPDTSVPAVDLVGIVVKRAT
jgi:hypothetical protein